eukprot:1297779-Pleurochrysis_carterae.AAC.1
MVPLLLGLAHAHCAHLWHALTHAPPLAAQRSAHTCLAHSVSKASCVARGSQAPLPALGLSCSESPTARLEAELSASSAASTAAKFAASQTRRSSFAAPSSILGSKAGSPLRYGLPRRYSSFGARRNTSAPVAMAGSGFRNPKGLPTKECVVCGRPFTWRKKWERCWDEVTTCSKRCNGDRRRNKGHAADD